jgi:hypothetical protein
MKKYKGKWGYPEKYKAEMIKYYQEKYFEYICDNGLDNDSRQISVESLVEFVETEILINEEDNL